MGKGAVAGERDDQLVLRRDSLAKDPAFDGEGRPRFVLQVSRETHDVAGYELVNGRRRVSVRGLTWAHLAACSTHPLAEEFRRYLAWRSG
jgi:hypothetical protein